jgi:NAD(P)-dependent dehydrogenase (short-subunit alcohol dehydrogenase family)
MEIKNHTFVISGGASGLGAATARHLHLLGANLVLLDLNSDAGSMIQKELGKNVLFFLADVTSESQINSALEQAQKKFSRLDGLINCAGIETPGKIIDREGHPLPLEVFKKVMDINVNGTVNLIRLFVAAKLKMIAPEKLKTSENAVIINTASVAAYEGQIGQIAYATSKGAIVSLCLPLARELAAFGMRVVTIAPGIFETPMLARLSPEAQSSLGQIVPFPKRLGRPDEYAFLAQHIIENQMINGEVIRLDGAIRLTPK